MKKLILILTVAIGLVTGCNSSTPETPQEIAKAYIEACLKGNLDEANSYFSKQAKPHWKETSYSQINFYTNQVEDISKFEIKTEINKINEKKNFKQIYIYMLNETGKKGAFKQYNKKYDRYAGKVTNEISPNLIFDFVFENGKWKIKIGA